MHNDPKTTARLEAQTCAAREAAIAFALVVAGPVRTIARTVADWPGRRASFPPHFVNLCAIVCTLAISGCAGNAPQPEQRADPFRPGATTNSEPRICHIDRALLAAPRAPDCGFGRSELKTVDPEQWARLKLEFEKKCYQHAEKIVRDRLRQLQVASRCEVEQASR
jgi:hypothetical protein